MKLFDDCMQSHVNASIKYLFVCMHMFSFKLAISSLLKYVCVMRVSEYHVYCISVLHTIIPKLLLLLRITNLGIKLLKWTDHNFGQVKVGQLSQFS